MIRIRAKWIPLVTLLMPWIPATTAAQSPEEQIQTALTRAAEAEIPLSLLESRIQEGRAKGVPMDGIAAGVEHRLEGLFRAEDALAAVPDVAPADLDVGADALESGVSEDVLAELARTAPRESRAAAVATLTHLVTQGIVPEQALTQVESALTRGPQALRNLPAQAGVPDDIGPPSGVPAGPWNGVSGPGRIPTGIGPPVGVPAPGEVPAGGSLDGAGPPSRVPTGPPTP